MILDGSFRGYKNILTSSNIVSISGNIFLYPPEGHRILYKYSTFAKQILRYPTLDLRNEISLMCQVLSKFAEQEKFKRLYAAHQLLHL